MTRVELLPKSSLGGIIRKRGIFGCGSLHHLAAIRQRRSLLEAAYRWGFRQFDVAPGYGNGLAERVVEAFASEVGFDVKILTKMGILISIYPSWTGHVFLAARAWDSAFGSHRRAYRERCFASETVDRSLAESPTRLQGRAPARQEVHQ